MSFAILRLRKRPLAAATAMAGHALRHGRAVRNADPEKAAANLRLIGQGTTAEVMAELRAALPEKRRKDAVCCIELLITASPETLRGWKADRQDAYFKAATRWLGDRFGGLANVKLAVIHRDETTPHLQILLVPLKDGKLQANKMLGGPAGLRQLQTDFAKGVGERFGLQRGIERKPGEERPAYQSISRWYAAIAAVGNVSRIPPVRPVPPIEPAGEPPGRFSTASRRAEYDQAEKMRLKALQERQEAIEANKARTRLVEQLAEVGITVFGKQARSVGERIAKANLADQTLARIRAEGSELLEQKARLEADIAARRQVLELGVLEQQREALVREVIALQKERQDLAPSERPRSG